MNGNAQYTGVTYKTRDNAMAAFLRKYDLNPGFNWFIAVNADGRFYPVCIGERAAQAGTHFHFLTVN